jgi:bacterioferritin
MKGSPIVLEQLNHALRDELTAINQYFLHAEMAENWGYKKYSKYIKKQSIDETKHAEMLMERILFLDGTPSMDPMSLTTGKTVKEMIESDLKLEHEAVASYNDSIRVCVENADNGFNYFANGRTPGKWIARTRILSLTGERMGLSQCSSALSATAPACLKEGSAFCNSSGTGIACARKTAWQRPS